MLVLNDAIVVGVLIKMGTIAHGAGFEPTPIAIRRLACNSLHQLGSLMQSS